MGALLRVNAQVVVFYDDLSSPVISELENVEESTEDFEFYQVDITEAGNRVEARRVRAVVAVAASQRVDPPLCVCVCAAV